MLVLVSFVRKIEAKNGLENYCFTMRNTLNEEKLKDASLGEELVDATAHWGIVLRLLVCSFFGGGTPELLTTKFHP